MITNDSQMTGAIGESLVVAELIKKRVGGDECKCCRQELQGY